MANSASIKYIEVSHQFQFNYSEMKDLQPEQFVTSPVFHALGNEWVIDCYPQGSRQELSCNTSFLVRVYRKWKTVYPTFSLHLKKRDEMSYTPSNQYLKEYERFQFAVQKSPFQGQVYGYGEYPNSSFEKDFVNDGCFELICIINNTDIPHSRCFIRVPKSFDLHSHIEDLLETTEKADLTFHVENRSFMCHRLILAARSPVFKAEFFGNMAVVTQKHIKIEDISPEVFEAMLHFIYTDSVPSCYSEKKAMKFTQHLFVAADRYAIEGLKSLCEDKLCAYISLDMVTATLALALQHNSPRLKNACLDFIAEPGTLISLMLCDEYVDLVRSFPSIMAEIRGKVDTVPSFKDIKIQKI
ncbi:BTB/POZ and MATH domain-containing protein 3-like [Carex rostrata]